MEIPKAEVGIIGGSSTLSIDFPGELDLDWARMIEKDLVFNTPYGMSPAFKLIEIDSPAGVRRALCCKMHGWRASVRRADASRQVFWVFEQAGVRRVLAEGGVGSVSRLLDPRDLIIPDDYLDFSMRKDTGLSDKYLLVMRESMCSELRTRLIESAHAEGGGRVFKRGVYAVTDGRHFESPAEVRFLATAGADVVGQSLCPEVYLAREIGACYAGIYLVVNYGEGVVEPWQHRELAEIFYSEGYAIGRILLSAARDFAQEPSCACAGLRKETLLKGIYE
ncbi:MAG: MTAP family purine nucleoside phosphorylase [Solirubrobacterales bacterium]